MQDRRSLDAIRAFAALVDLDLEGERADAAWEMLRGWMERFEALAMLDLDAVPPATVGTMWEVDGE